MAWVADLTLDDKNMSAPPVLQPGQQFTKSWRLRNAGTCAWSPDFALTYRSGNVPAAKMGGNSFKIGKAVAPGQTIDLSANLVAPRSPASTRASGRWRTPPAAVWRADLGQHRGARAGPGRAGPTQTPAPG